MATDNQEVYAKFDDNIEKIRENGIGLHLSDNQMDDCFIKYLIKLHLQHDSVNKPTKTVKSLHTERNISVTVSGSATSLSVYLFKNVICWSLLLVFIGVVYMFSDCIGSWLFQCAVHVLFPVLYYTRKASLPFIKQVDISGLYDEFCLLENPYHKDTQFSCDIYEASSKMMVVSSLETLNFQQILPIHTHPIHLKGEEAIISFDDISLFYHKNRDVFNGGVNVIKASDPEVANLTHIFNSNTASRLNDSEYDLHIEWRVKKLFPVRLLSELVDQPKFLQSKSFEFGAERLFTFDSAKSATFKLPRTTLENVVIQQLYGSRKLQLVGRNNCDVPSQNITLKAGHTVFFKRYLWDGWLHPMNSSQMSVIYISAFA